MNEQELNNLVNEIRMLPRETEWVEFKASTIKPDEKLGDYISGLSNAACVNNQPFAYLVLGIDNDDHSVKGSNYNFTARKHGNDDLEFWLKRYLSPSIRFDYFIFKYDNNHTVEIFRIPAAVGEPVTFKGKPSIRIGTSLTHLKNYPHYAKIIYNSQYDWSAQIIEKATITDLEPEAVKLARQVYKEKQAGKAFYNDIDNWTNEVFLDKAKLTINGKITNTAIILLGKPESAHFLSPAVAQITWKLDTEEKAYEHFEIPLFTSINDVLKRIRNVKYKFFPNNQLIATEVLKYDPEVILEALNNCIAHQDYNQYSRILLTEQTGKLIFSNAGGFFEGTADDYTLGQKTPMKYRNRWLTNAMVTLNMIDSMGYGIHKMYKSQKQRFFPLPDYSKSTPDEVVLEIYGHSIDENYSKLLIEQKDNLDLTDAILLDKVQKSQSINDDAARKLRKKGLIEGRKPNYYVAAHVAEATNQKAGYIKNRGLKDDHYKKLIIDMLRKYGKASKEEIDELILDILPAVLDKKQKQNKVRNLIYAMHKRDKTIENKGTTRHPVWVLASSNSERTTKN
jgi:ATP-dependent DNA helicase RecG